MFTKAAKNAAATGSIAAATIVTLAPHDVSAENQAILSAIITVGSFLWTCLTNWRKHR